MKYLKLFESDQDGEMNDLIQEMVNDLEDNYNVSIKKNSTHAISLFPDNKLNLFITKIPTDWYFFAQELIKWNDIFKDKFGEGILIKPNLSSKDLFCDTAKYDSHGWGTYRKGIKDMTKIGKKIYSVYVLF